MMARTRSTGAKGKSRARQAQGQAPGRAQGRSRTGAAGQGQAGRSRPPAPTIAPTAPAYATGDTSARARNTVAARESGAAAVSGPPLWLRLSTLVLAIIGLGISVYLTIVHYTTAAALACPNTTTVNCEKVITSPESVVFGVPVPVLGLAFFVLMVALTTPMAWRAGARVIHLTRLVGVVAGMAFVLYLIYAELFKVNAICLWCTGVHVVTFALFVLVLYSAAMWGAGEPADRPA